VSQTSYQPDWRVLAFWIAYLVALIYGLARLVEWATA
jgi:hypothetical protein